MRNLFLALMAVVFFFGGCQVTTSTTRTPLSPPADTGAEGDADTDCDADTDADTDCDTDSDTDATTPWYLDDDGDGYGDPNYEVWSTTQPHRYVENHQDCDDFDAARNPSATETCNGLDDDCDDLVDEDCDTETDTGTPPEEDCVSTPDGAITQCSSYDPSETFYQFYANSCCTNTVYVVEAEGCYGFPDSEPTSTEDWCDVNMVGVDCSVATGLGYYCW